jgi:hypothetical protein
MEISGINRMSCSACPRELTFRLRVRFGPVVLVGVSLLAAPCVTANRAAAEGIAPGEWKLTETIVMNGNKAAPQSRTRCFSPEQASDTATTFLPDTGTMNSTCTRVEFNSSATALRWRMRCTGQMEMDVSGDFTFDTPQHYSATVVSKGAMGGREVVNTTVSIEGERVGECR